MPEAEVKELTKCSHCSEEINPDNNNENIINGNVFCDDCFSELFTFCNHCEETIPIDDSYYQDDNTYCQPCYDEFYTTCDSCGETISRNDCLSNNGGSNYCQPCYDEIYTTCDSCGEAISRNDCLSNNSGSNYCQSCYDDIYTNCESCGEDVNREDMTYHEATGQDLCQFCYNSQDTTIHNYEYKPSPIFHTLNNNKLYLGIELEIDKGDDKQDCAEALKSLSDDENLFYLKEDGSLDNGIEIVSHPSTLEYHKKFFDWNNIFNTARRYNFLSHDAKTCGLHIHIPRKFLTYSEAIKIGLFVNLNEREIEIIARRRSDCYAAFKKVEKLKDAGYSNGRYEAVNFTNRNTIEFRMFKGTLKSNTFFASLEFVESLVSFVKTVNTQQVVKNGFNLYLDYVLNNKKQYKILIEYLKSKNLIREELKKCA